MTWTISLTNCLNKDTVHYQTNPPVHHTIPEKVGIIPKWLITWLITRQLTLIHQRSNEFPRTVSSYSLWHGLMKEDTSLATVVLWTELQLTLCHIMTTCVDLVSDWLDITIHMDTILWPPYIWNFKEIHLCIGLENSYPQFEATHELQWSRANYASVYGVMSMMALISP